MITRWKATILSIFGRRLLTIMLIVGFMSGCGGMLHIKQNIPKKPIPRQVKVIDNKIEGEYLENVLQNWIDLWEDDLKLRKLLGE